MVAVIPPLFYCPSRKKIEMTIVRVVRKKLEQGYEVKLSKTIRVKVVKVGFHQINSQG